MLRVPPPLSPPPAPQAVHLLRLLCRKRDKPTLADKRQDIEALKVWLGVAVECDAAQKPPLLVSQLWLCPNSRRRSTSPACICVAAAAACSQRCRPEIEGFACGGDLRRLEPKLLACAALKQAHTLAVPGRSEMSVQIKAKASV